MVLSHHAIAFTCAAVLLLMFLFLVLWVLIDDTRRKCKHGKSKKGGKCGSEKPHCCPTPKEDCTDFASFYAVMGCQVGADNDNPVPLAGGEIVRFPRPYASKGTNNIILNPDQANFPDAILLKKKGVYEIKYTIPVSDPGGQVVLVLQNNDSPSQIEQAETLNGQSGQVLLTGIIQLVVEVCDLNITIRNAVNNPQTLTVTPCAGSSSEQLGTAWLVVSKIA